MYPSLVRALLASLFLSACVLADDTEVADDLETGEELAAGDTDGDLLELAPGTPPAVENPEAVVVPDPGKADSLAANRVACRGYYAVRGCRTSASLRVAAYRNCVDVNGGGYQMGVF